MTGFWIIWKKPRLRRMPDMDLPKWQVSGFDVSAGGIAASQIIY